MSINSLILSLLEAGLPEDEATCLARNLATYYYEKEENKCLTK